MVEASRVAEIIVELPDGTTGRGSGYRTETTAVLTAAHVVENATHIRVRFDADTGTEWETKATCRWSDTRADLAVLSISPRGGELSSVGFGRIGDGDAVLPASAVGFPLWKLKNYDGTVITDDGRPRYRDTHQATGMVAVLSNRREGTLEFTVTPPERETDPAVSPWQGMSGAALWIGDRIVGVIARHHRGDGLGRLTAVRLIPEPLVFPELPDVIRPRLSDLILTDYRKQVEAVAPEKLLDREDELAELTRFVAGTEPYGWWQAGPWAGKSALMAWFVLHPPEGVDVVSFFVTGRLAAQEDSEAFTKELTLQLAALAGEHLPDVLTMDGRQNQLWRLLDRAAARPRRLVVVLDGLDEDAGAVHGKPSIASLLPKRPPENVRFLIASRPDPPVPADVLDEDHPLLTCPRHVLPASPHAKSMGRRAVNELNRHLAGDDLQREVLGLITASGGGLTRADLEELTGRPPYEIDRLLDGLLGRTIGSRPARLRPGEDPPVHLFAHETLAQAARAKFGSSVRGYRARLHAWADTYRDRGWPEDTPRYLLLGYAHMVVDDHDRLVAVCTDRARHDRMLRASGGDALAASEVQLAQDVLHGAPVPDLSALLLLAVQRDELARRNSEIPLRLPLVWMMLGDPARAEALAHGITDRDSRARSLIALAEFAGRKGERERFRALVKDVRTLAQSFSSSFTHDAVSRELATAAAQAGEPDLAISIARDIRDPRRLDMLLVQLAESAVADGDHALALRFGSHVSTVHDRRHIFLELAGSATTPSQFAQAWTLTEGMTEADIQADFVGRCVRDAVATGEPERVHGFLAVIANPETRDHATMVAAEEAAAKGQYEQALAFTRNVAEPAARAKTLARLVNTAQDAGAHEHATSLFTAAWTHLRDIAGHYERAEAAIAAVRAIAKGVLPTPAHVLLAGTEEIVRAASDPRDQLVLLPQLASTAAALGDRNRARALLDEAEGVAGGLTGEEYRDRTRVWLSRNAITAGEYEWALARIHGITNLVEQARTMTGLAETVAASGDCDRALSLVASAALLIRTADDRDAHTLVRAAWVATACDDHELALELVNDIPDTEHRDTELAELARAAVDKGDHERALSLVRRIIDGRNQHRVLTALVRAIAVVDDHKRALVLVRHFRNAPDRTEMLAEMAGAAAKAGRYERAVELASSITEPFDRTHAHAALVRRAVTEHAWDTAVTLLRGMDPMGMRTHVLIELVVAIATAGDPELAATQARDLAAPDHLPEVLIRLAEAAASAGDRDRARALLAEVTALRSALLHRDDLSTRAVDVAIAAGDRDQALALARKIADPNQRLNAFTRLAEAAVHAGDHRTARDLVVMAEELARTFAYAGFLTSITGLVVASIMVGEQDRADRLVQANPDPDTRAHILANSAELTGESAAGRTLLTDAVAAANDIPDAGPRALMLTRLVGVAGTIGQRDLVTSIVTEAEIAVMAATRVESYLELITDLTRAASETGHHEVTRSLLATAEALTSTIARPDRDENVLATLAEATVAIGDLEHARDLARDIAGNYARHRVVATLALAVEETGDHDLVLSVIQDLDSTDDRNDVLQSLMERAVMRGDHDRARTLALAATDWYDQARKLIWLARFATAFGAHERAVALVKDNSRTRDVVEGLAWLVRAAVAAGDHERARALATEIPASHRVNTDQYLSGLMPAGPDLYPGDLLARIIDVMIAAGDRESALSLARDITDHSSRDAQLATLVDAAITADDRDQALSVAREITDPLDRAAALSRVVTAVAAAGDTTHARALLAEVLVLGHWYDSVRLVARVAPDALAPVLDEIQSRL